MSAAARQAGNTGQGFLRFNSKPPKIFITSDDVDFDPLVIEQWQDEGFDVSYIPFNGDIKAYKSTLMHIGDQLDLSEHYALIAYDAAATAALDACAKPHHHLVALIAYYPTKVPSPKTKYPNQLDLLIHLAGSQGLGTAHKNYVYPGTEPGFAETDLEEYEKIAADLAWSRTVVVVRKAFRINVELEPVWDEYLKPEFYRADAGAALSTMVDRPIVNHVPTMTGGVGQKDLFRFYQDHFIAHNPPMNIKLVSRTIGTDHVVDEMIVSFRHSRKMDWILPDVPPTNKLVSIPIVCVVAIRCGKLQKESLYWDQASVLVQVGLLDPKLVPESMKSKGMKRLPVCGAEAAQKVLDEDSHPSNQLIPSWRQAPPKKQTHGKSQRPPSPD